MGRRRATGKGPECREQRAEEFVPHGSHSEGRIVPGLRLWLRHTKTRPRPKKKKKK